MTRMLSLLLAICCVLTLGVTFKISHDTQKLEEQLAADQAGIRHERERYRLLRAEWGTLNAPKRLESMLDKAKQDDAALLLSPISGDQLLQGEQDIARIPMRMAPGTEVPDMPIPLPRPADIRPIELKSGIVLATIGGVDS